MTDVIEDMKEEGEIESDEAESEIYKKVDRPQEINKVNNINCDRYNSESSPSSDDSDGETPHKKFMKRLEKPPQAAASVSASSRSKNGHMWKNMLQEESLMENLKTCDVSSRKRKFERGAESYDFENAARMSLRSEEEAAGGGKFLKRRRMDISGNDSSNDSSEYAKSRKRAKKNRNKNRGRSSPKLLPDLIESLTSTDEDFGRDMAEKLEEEKSDLIVRVVSVIGKEASLNLFKITQRIERDGGMLTMNKIRRRTPGGIFLFLLKTSDKIDEELKKEIFDVDKNRSEKSISDRKMSSEQLSRDPPNSPANPDLLENGKLTDPDLVSQKILNFTTPESGDDILDLNYNDMDTF